MKLVLIGYMGSGKTAVGKELAEKVGYEFFDLDSHLEMKEGKSITDIFSKEGEIYFRKKENKLLKELINEKNNMVLSLGGGTPCYYDTIDFLISEEKCILIYLKTSPDTLTDRLFNERAKRPLIAHIDNRTELNDFIRKHLFERATYYNKAEMIIETEEKTIGQIVEDILVGLF